MESRRSRRLRKRVGKAWGAGGTRAVDIPLSSPTRSTLIDQSKRMKYWQWPIGNYLYNARNEQFTYSRKLICYST